MQIRNFIDVQPFLTSIPFSTQWNRNSQMNGDWIWSPDYPSSEPGFEHWSGFDCAMRIPEYDCIGPPGGLGGFFPGPCMHMELSCSFSRNDLGNDGFTHFCSTKKHRIPPGFAPCGESNVTGFLARSEWREGGDPATLPCDPLVLRERWPDPNLSGTITLIRAGL